MQNNLTGSMVDRKLQERSIQLMLAMLSNKLVAKGIRLLISFRVLLFNFKPKLWDFSFVCVVDFFLSRALWGDKSLGSSFSHSATGKNKLNLFITSE